MKDYINFFKTTLVVLTIAILSFFLYSNVKLHDSVAKGWVDATSYSGIDKIQKSPEYLFRAESKIASKLSEQQEVVYGLNRNRLMLEGKVTQGSARLKTLERFLEAKAKEYLTLKEDVKGSNGNFELTKKIEQLFNSINRKRLEKSNLLANLERSREALTKNYASIEIANSTILQMESDLENIRLTQSLAEVFQSDEGVLSSEAASEINSIMADVQIISETLADENYSYISDYIIETSLATEDSFDQFLEDYKVSEDQD